MDPSRPPKTVDATVVNTKTPARRPPVPEKTDLERFLRVDGPELLRRHAANIVLAVLLIAAATMFFYNRSRNKAAEQVATNQNTAIAYDDVTIARDLFTVPEFTENIARQRQQKVREVLSAVDLVLNSDAGAAQKAAAQLSKAEIFWSLGNAPAQAIATSQPTAGFGTQSPADYLTQAEQAYAEILTKYAEQKEYAANALIGLAAIDETRSKFDDAGRRYQQVIDDKTLRSAYRDIATARLKMLADLRLPYTLAVPTSQPAGSPTSQPTTPFLAQPSPANAGPPATMPSWTPTTLPAPMPTVAPSTLPTSMPSYAPVTP